MAKFPRFAHSSGAILVMERNVLKNLRGKDDKKFIMLCCFHGIANYHHITNLPITRLMFLQHFNNVSKVKC